MLLPRIIPCLLVQNKALVKTFQFKDAKYVGDPINAVKIFNEKEVDEIIILDIDCTVNHISPDLNMIKNLALECRMPLCYGGGIKSVDQAREIFSLGVEKIAISSAAIENPNLISEMSKIFGSQSVVVVLDVKKNINTNKYEIYINNGKLNTKIDPFIFSLEAQNLGAGEILLNSIDNDGLMKGYDLDLIRQIRNIISIPLTVLGGAGSLTDFGNVIQEHGIIGVASGSFFIFKGKFKAVLINYPSDLEKIYLIENYFINKK